MAGKSDFKENPVLNWALTNVFESSSQLSPSSFPTLLGDNSKYFSLRSASDQLQVLIAQRIVEKVDHPNLILDNGILWDRPLLFTPRLNSIPQGWLAFQFRDSHTISRLGLPSLGNNDGQDLYILGTGPYYIINRGQVTLTALREYELKEARGQGRTGNISNYHQLASQLPQSTIVLYCTQSTRPVGYQDRIYGCWDGHLVVLKSQVPSAHKAPIRSNLHTVTLIFSSVDIASIPMGLRLCLLN